MDATLAQCRQRLVARTEQVYAVSVLQPSALDRAAGGSGAAAEGGTEGGVEGGEVASLAALLRREREGGDAPQSKPAPLPLPRRCSTAPRAEIACGAAERDCVWPCRGPGLELCSSGLCSVCLCAPNSSMLLPCRHELCTSCAAVVRAHSGRCPLCRTAVASISDLRMLTYPPTRH